MASEGVARKNIPVCTARVRDRANTSVITARLIAGKNSVRDKAPRAGLTDKVDKSGKNGHSCSSRFYAKVTKVVKRRLLHLRTFVTFGTTFGRVKTWARHVPE